MRRKKFKGLNRILSMMLVFVMGFTLICATILADDETTPDHSAATETVTLTAIESLTADTEIVAYFYQQTYTVEATVGENGTVSYSTDSGSTNTSFESGVEVDFSENSTVMITATPTTGYHVASVIINNVEQTDVDTSNDSTYTKEITITGDTIITVTFEINTYTLTVEETGEDVSGTVTVDGSEYSGALTCDHGSSAALEITPPSGYNASVTVNDENVTLAYDHDHSCFTYTISSIFENISVLVEYSEYGTLEASDVLTCSTCSNTGTDPDGNTIYYYRSSATISVSDSYENTYKILQSDGSYETTYIVSETTDGTLTLTLFDGEKWYTVDTGIIFVIDGAAPVISITSTLTEKGVTTVEGTVSDSGSGVASLYYTYTEKGQTKTVNVEFDSNGNFTITYKGDQHTTYTLYAEDNAGNKTDGTDLDVLIDTVAPDIEITSNYDGSWTNENVTIKGTVDDGDDGSGIASLYYTYTDENGDTVTDEDGDPVKVSVEITYDTSTSGSGRDQTTTTSTTSGSFSITFENEQNITYTLYAEDESGNVTVLESSEENGDAEDEESEENKSEEEEDTTSCCVTFTVKIDKTSPYLTAGTSTSDWHNGSVTISGVVSDAYTVSDGETVSNSVYSDIAEIYYKDANGKKVSDIEYDPETGKYAVTLTTGQDTAYSVYAVDDAGNETEITDLTVKIDTTAPEVVTFEFENEDGEPVENTGEDYEYFFGEDITVTITAEDESPSSGIDSITYYLVDVYDGTTDTVTASVDEDGRISFELSADFKGYIYAKATDNVRNTGEYVSPSGTVLETEDMHSDTASIVFDYDDPNSNGYYDDDVEVIVTVSDTYSGIASIEWSVTSADPSNDQSGTESGFTTVSKDENLITSMSKTITVSSNSNDIVLKVTLTDNAGNTTTKSILLDIDKTDPEISVSYSNNDAENGTYFDANRTATITITERNLDTSDVVITVTKDGSSYSVGSLKWTKKSGSGNGDGTTWTAKITYSSDGDYTFSISVKDLAGNKNGSVSYGSSVAPTSFTIDKTAPVISVSYSNNNASNGTYFNASRTATITITEHNFDPSLVEITVTASLDGSTISTPAVSSWSTSGNTHTATIVYSADGDHTFDISMTDLAGNANSGVSYGSSVAYDSFTIDTTLYTDDGTGIITGVEDGAAYSGDVIPGVYFSDINYDEGSVVITLTRTRKGEIDEDVTDEFITGNYTETSSGVSAVFDVFDKTKDNDGIYTLYVSYLDLAGNFVSQSVTFTINRYGSVYVYSDDLANLISDGGAYVQSVSGLSLIITEYNPDKLVEDSLSIEITLDGKPLENVIYTVTPVINDEVEIGESGWYQYEYVLSEENFTSDGVYKITISSTDETGNNSENTNEEIYDEIIFRIDTTAPEITSITGLEKSIINAKTQEVTFTVYDTIGLYQIVVTVTDADGDVILTCTISGDDFNGDINNYTGTFSLTESGLAQTITIEVTDIAGNVIKTSDESFDPAYTVYTTVTLSTNFFVRWYANTFLFWFSVAAIVIIIGLIIFFILFKKRKKEDEEEAGTTAADGFAHRI